MWSSTWAWARSFGEHVGASRRIGTHHHPTSRYIFVVAGLVTDSDSGRELTDGVVDDRQQVRSVVRSGVPRTQHPRQGVAGGVGEAEQRTEPVPAVVMRSRPVLVLGMDLDKGRIDIEGHLSVAVDRRGASPRSTTDFSHCLTGPIDRVGGERLGERAIQRRIGTHVAEQAVLGCERFDVGT
jgi:hypothetical protein